MYQSCRRLEDETGPQDEETVRKLQASADRLVLCTLCALPALIHFLGSTDCWRGKSLCHMGGTLETWLAGLFIPNLS